MTPYIKLIRPSNCIITLLSIVVASILTGGTGVQWVAIAAAAFSGAFISAGGMVINDILDVEIDKVNKPDRPLAAGTVTMDHAKLLYIVLNAVGLAFDFVLPPSAQYIALLAVLFIYFYSAVLKRTVLFGNLAVGCMTGLAFIYGGASVGGLDRALLPALFAFLINVGREIIKDMEDVEGDRRNGAMTLPVKYGLTAGAAVATFFLVFLIAAAIYPYAAGLYTWKYFLLVAAGMITVLAYVIYSLWTDTSVSNLHRLSTIIKYDMIVGLAAIFFG
jgi:geranylgeranylglycerol-phosphate geranylgeranyltransferase